MSSVGKNVEQLLFAAVGNVKCYNYLEKPFVSYKIKHILPHDSGLATQERWKPMSTKRLAPYIHSSFSYNSTKLETTQMPIYRWMDKQFAE